MTTKHYKEHGIGWDKIVDPLIEYCEKRGIKILQVKEKFGGLRFYTETNTEELDELIRQAEEKCSYTCEECGEEGKMTSYDWMRVLCPKHMEEFNKRRSLKP